MFEENVLVTVLVDHPQFIHCRVEMAEFSLPVNMTIIYASGLHRERMELWDGIHSFANGTMPWLVAGDFNAVTSVDERRGRGGPRLGEMDDFDKCILDTGLIDGGFSGSKFTWTSKRAWARLDRMLFNTAWTDCFERSSINHLARKQSDHCPLLLETQVHVAREPRAFRFQNMWLKHHLFGEVVAETWNQPTMHSGMRGLWEKFKRLKQLRWWNWNVFGDINVRVRDLEKEVKAAEERFDELPTLENLCALNRCNAEYTLKLNMQEYMWKQKASVRWVKDGERNTKLFQAAVKKKRAKNLIHSVQDGEDVLTDMSDIKASWAAYFKKILGGGDFQPREHDLGFIPSLVTAEDNELLTAIPAREEVKGVVSAMSPDTVAGTDGFTTKFFQGV